MRTRRRTRPGPARKLPTEAEWEYAARGGLKGATYAWGREPFPSGQVMANTWQGELPWQNLCLDGFAGTSPVASFPPNGYGLCDMIGKVWEWTRDRFDVATTGAGLLRAGRAPRSSAACDQGRLPSVRSELLPALPAGGAPERDRGHLDRPYRVPLRQSRSARRFGGDRSPSGPNVSRRRGERPLQRARRRVTRLG